MNDAAVHDFLQRHGLSVDSVDVGGLVDGFLAEMELGLAGRPASLAMLPTYLSADRPIPANTPVLVLDAGGTNLRVARIVFDQAAKPTFSDMTRVRMPGSDREVDKETFFQRFVDLVLPLAPETEAIGFCFSYATQITPDGDGRLVHWSKEIKAPDIVGELIGAHLKERLAERGVHKRITLLNDTTATLLAGRTVDPARRFSRYAGVIVGTGTNTAYVESNRNITGLSDLDPDAVQAINVESGNFNKMPAGDIDTAFAAATANPERYRLEKMISGAYLGGLVLHATKTATREKLLTRTGGETLAAVSELSTRDMDTFRRNPYDPEVPALAALCPQDTNTVLQIANAVVLRATRLAAVSIAAACIKGGEGNSPLHPLCVTVDGSTYYKTKHYRALTQGAVRRILAERGVSVEFTRVEEAPLLGAGIAGLCGVTGRP